MEVVKEFVELHKGKIEVESQVGQGTSFKITFPLGSSLYKGSEIIEEKYKIESKNELLSESVRDEIESNSEAETQKPIPF